MIDDQGNGLLSDFGLARINREGIDPETEAIQGGRYRYIAPELWSSLLSDNQIRTTCASDSYTFALTIWALVTLQRPFGEATHPEAAVQEAAVGRRPSHSDWQGRAHLPPDIQNALWTLLNSMWAHDPQERPSLETVEIKLQTILSLFATTSATN